MSNESPVFNSSIPSNAKFADSNFIGDSAWIHKFFVLPFDHDGTDLSEDFLDILDIIEVHFNPATSKTRYQTNPLKHRFKKLGESPTLGDSVISIHQSLTNTIMLAHIPTEFFSWSIHLTTAADEIFLNVRAGTTEHDLTENQNSVKSDIITTSTVAELNVSHTENSRESFPDTQINTDNPITLTKPDTNTMAHISSDIKGNISDTKGNVLDTPTTYPSTQTTDTTAVNRDTAFKESVLYNNQGNVLDNLASYKDPSYLSKVHNNEPLTSHTTEHQTQDMHDTDNDDSKDGAFLQPKKTFMLHKVQLKETVEMTMNNHYDSLDAADDKEDDNDRFDDHLLCTLVTPGAGPDHETASSSFHSSREYLFTQPSASPPSLSRAHIHGISTQIAQGQHDLIPIDNFVKWINTKTSQGQAHFDHMLETTKSKSKQVVASHISETKDKIDHLDLSLQQSRNIAILSRISAMITQQLPHP